MMEGNSIKRWGIFGATLALLAAPGCGKDNEEPQDPDAAESHDSSGHTDRGSSDTLASNSAVLVLKQEDLTLTGGRSADITLDIPEGVVSITISVVGQAGVNYGICKWTSPDGVLIKEGWQSEDATKCPSCANYLRTHERVFAVVAPNNPSATVGPGAHLLSICASEAFGSSSSKVRFAA